MLGAIVLAVAAWPVGMATASADAEAIYLADLRSSGFTSPLGAAAQVAEGRKICALLAAGNEPLAIALNFQQQSGFDIRNSYVIVDIAASDLCPELGKGIGMRNPP